MLALHDWQNFYVLTGTAAATLIGLLFVAFSISLGSNLSRQQATDSLHTFVEPTLFYYVQALTVSCLAVMPLASSLLLSCVLLVLGSIDIFLAVKVCWRILVVHRDEGIALSHWIWHIALPLLAGILCICVGIGLYFGLQLALVGLALVDLLFLAIGLHNTWALTVWLLLHRERPHMTQDEHMDDQQTAG